MSGIVLDSAIAVHKEMGPGLLESIYHECMLIELESRGIPVNTMVPMQLTYKGRPLSRHYIIDLLVGDEIILELKATDGIFPVHQAQIISYLKLANKRLGFLINFNAPLLKQGFKRFVNGF